MPDPAPLPMADGPSWALFLDLDGTLLELADHPKNVVVPEGLCTLLRRLHRSLDGALAIVSGRSLADIDRLLCWSDVDAAGCHGAELRLGGITTRDIDPTLVAVVSDRLAHIMRQVPKTFVERKGQSVAVHYSPEIMGFPEIAARAETALSNLPRIFHVVAARNVAEVKPRNATKGEAIRKFLRSPRYRNRLPVFIGDDLPDEDAFAEANLRGGYSVRIGGHGPSNARFSFETVTELRGWLEGPLLTHVERPRKTTVTKRSVTDHT